MKRICSVNHLEDSWIHKAIPGWTVPNYNNYRSKEEKN